MRVKGVSAWILKLHTVSRCGILCTKSERRFMVKTVKDAYVHAKADKQLKRKIKQFQNKQGFDNESQATRRLIELGLKKGV